MNTRQIHLGCDFFILFCIIIILFSFYLINSSLEDNLFIIKRLNISWEKKPYQYIQSTFTKPCKELGMLDLYSFQWPGTLPGCLCKSESLSTLTKGSCPKDANKECSTIPAYPSNLLNKWKNNYVCGSTLNSKTYFQWNKVSPGASCPDRYKKCGIIDTLWNTLCINQNENCPINSLEFINTADNTGIVLKVSNDKEEDGKIYSDFKIEETEPCLNPDEISFEEKYNTLLNTNREHNYTCNSYISTDYASAVYSDPNYHMLDDYDQRSFYEQNGLAVEKFEDIGILNNLNNRKVKFLGGLYIGWKRECQKKEIFSFLNKGNGKEEISKALFNTKSYNLYIDILLISHLLGFLIGIMLFKYYNINMNSGKLEFSSKGVTYLFLMYFLLAILNGMLIYFSDISLEILKSSKMANDFFEMISIIDCSDDITNNSLRHYKKIFYSNASRYFNVKLFSFFNFLFCMFFLFYIYVTKIQNNEGGYKRYTKNKHITNKQY